MAFTSTTFLLFFLPLAILLYLSLAQFKKDLLKNIVLVLLSLIFYAFAGLQNVGYLLVFILIIYLMGIVLEKRKNLGVFWLFISFVVLIMAYYKYGSFLYQTYKNINLLGITFSDILVPLGMSFIMFESISYLVDIYKREAKRGSLLDTYLFFLFFPKITSGPIVLWRDFQPQLRNRSVSVDQIFSGLERVMIGFAKKVLIADTLGGVLANITSNAFASNIDSKTAWLGMLLYFLQIYYDFSGYSDIAIGLSKIFGFDFKENFNYPYTATSLAEFWRRWHISLGTWFRTYIYIPLGGNRKNIYLNLFIVFMTTGIWHGSTMNFVIWGTLHAIFIVVERFLRSKGIYDKIPALVRWVIVMTFVSLTWVIFMLPNLDQVNKYFEYMFVIKSESVYFTYEYFLTNKVIFLVIVGLVGAFIGKFKFVKKISKWVSDSDLLVALRFMIYLIIFTIAVIFMLNSTYSPFLYFQF